MKNFFKFTGVVVWLPVAMVFALAAHAGTINSSGWSSGSTRTVVQPYGLHSLVSAQKQGLTATKSGEIAKPASHPKSGVPSAPRRRPTAAASLPPEVLYQANIAYNQYFDDGSWGPFEIGFPFTFFDSTYTQFYATSNGWISFDTAGLELQDGEGQSSYSNLCIPDVSTPNAYIAAFWTDMVIHQSGGVIYYQTIGSAPNRKCVIQCTNMGFWGDPTLLGTFSIILYEASNEIQIQYRIIVDNTSDQAHGVYATIGLENFDGTAGVQYYCGGGWKSPTGVAQPPEWPLASEQSIRFTPESGSYTIDSAALYDGILLAVGNPPSIPQLTTPSERAVVSPTTTLQWQSCDNTTSYEFLLSQSSTLEDATDFDLGLQTSITAPEGALETGTTYYWAIFAHGDDGTTWSEIREFTTSDSAPPTANPQTVWTTLGSDALVTLDGTGGFGPLTAVITALPAHGSLYQYIGGERGIEITELPADVIDFNHRVVFSVDDGATGVGRGNFEFLVKDTGGWESPAAVVTVNVYPAPTVVTGPVVVLDSTTATCGGNVTADGGSDVSARGVCWGTTPNPTVATFHSIDDTGLGLYVSSLTDLTPRGHYFIRAYALNASGIAYGTQYQFDAGLPTVQTTVPDSITATTARSGGTVVAAGGNEVTSRGVCWGPAVNPTTTALNHVNGVGLGSYQIGINNLESGTQYHLRAFASNVVGTSYGEDIPFTTVAVPTYAIAGHILTAGQAGVDSVVMHGLPGEPMTDADGAYVARVPQGWSGWVVPELDGYTFAPDSIGCDSVIADQTSEDYVGTDILSGVDGDGSVPRRFKLSQNHPNPFNPSTEIEFSLPRASFATLEIYNVMGQEVTTLVSSNLPPGNYHVTWDGSNRGGHQVSSGVYFYCLRAGEYASTKQMVFLK